MSKFEVLTKHLPALANDDYGEWVFDNANDDDRTVQMPYVRYTEAVLSFIQAVGFFQTENTSYGCFNYRAILQRDQIEWERKAMCSADISQMDAQGILALIVGAIQAGRFCEGELVFFFKNGAMQKWLMQLKTLDETQHA